MPLTTILIIIIIVQANNLKIDLEQTGGPGLLCTLGINIHAVQKKYY